MRKVEASTASLSSGEGKKAIGAGDLDKELGPAEKKRDLTPQKKTSYRKESKMFKSVKILPNTHFEINRIQDFTREQRKVRVVTAARINDSGRRRKRQEIH